MSKRRYCNSPRHDDQRIRFVQTTIGLVTATPPYRRNSFAAEHQISRNAAMSDDLTYECPHCRETVSVENALMGKVVDCPDCGQQFEVRAPVASPTHGEQSQNPHAATDARETGDERILRVVHPVVFRNHLLFTLCGLLLGLVGLSALGFRLVGRPLLGLDGMPLLVSGAVFLVAAAVYFLYRAVQAMSTTLKVTTERTIAISGILSKSTNEVQHDDVRNIKCARNLLERLLNYGDIALSSSGQDDMEIVLHDIPDPEGIVGIIRTYQ
jgi:hypothetical protein